MILLSGRIVIKNNYNFSNIFSRLFEDFWNYISADIMKSHSVASPPIIFHLTKTIQFILCMRFKIYVRFLINLRTKYQFLVRMPTKNVELFTVTIRGPVTIMKYIFHIPVFVS